MRSIAEFPGRSVVLIVEDDPSIQYILREILEESADCVVECLGDGAAALERIRQGGLDLVLLDLMLPGLTGLAVCQQVRQEAAPSSVHLPIIMVTARHQPIDERAGFEAGADDYITKPFSVDTLLARVRVWLRARQRATAAQAELVAQHAARQEAERRVLEAQLDAIGLAARELAHRLNNDLTMGIGLLDVLQERADVPADLRALAMDATDALERIARAVAQLQRVARLEIRETPVGPALDLDRSASPPDPSPPSYAG